MDKVISDVETILGTIYLVGGSVRDVLLGKTPKDYDFASPLNPDEIESKVRSSGKKAHITGKRFGTIGFKVGEHFVEVTTFRKETYGKTRKPHVEYVHDITEDLSRRDFTINAIALRGHHYIDPFGGKEDLSAKLIRSVGKPAERFNEDPLRMLRAARFAAQLDFEVEEHTLRAIERHGFKILNVSKERWMRELDRLLTSDHPDKGLHILADTDLVKYVLPEMRLQVGYDQHSPHHELSLWDHSVSTVKLSPNNVEARWAALLHDVGKPFVRQERPDRSIYPAHDIVGAEIVKGIAKRMNWSNHRQHEVAELVRTHLEDDENPVADADSLSRFKQD